MSLQQEIIRVLSDSLQLGDRATTFTAETSLLGSLPELDSMAVVGIITALEERFDIQVDDDEIHAEAFASVGSLCDFVTGKLGL